jgi:hypothetical protein
MIGEMLKLPPLEVMKLLSLSLKEHEVAIETPAILHENVLVEYTQPKMRWLDDDNTIHKRVDTNLRKVRSL